MQLRAHTLAILVLSACVNVTPGSVVIGSNLYGQEFFLPEGSHTVAPLTSTWTYDTRLQDLTTSLDAMLADGAPIHVAEIVITFRVQGDNLFKVNATVGPDYADVIIAPTVAATLGMELSKLSFSEVDSAHLADVQRSVGNQLKAGLAPWGIEFESVQMRDVTFLSSKTNRAITAISMTEQEVITARQELTIAKSRADARRALGEGIRDEFCAISPTLKPEVLKDAERRAWDLLVSGRDNQVYVVDAESLSSLEIEP